MSKLIPNEQGMRTCKINNRSPAVGSIYIDQLGRVVEVALQKSGCDGCVYYRSHIELDTPCVYISPLGLGCHGRIFVEVPDG